MASFKCDGCGRLYTQRKRRPAAKTPSSTPIHMRIACAIVAAQNAGPKNIDRCFMQHLAAQGVEPAMCELLCLCTHDWNDMHDWATALIEGRENG